MQTSFVKRVFFLRIFFTIFKLGKMQMCYESIFSKLFRYKYAIENIKPVMKALIVIEDKPVRQKDKTVLIKVNNNHFTDVGKYLTISIYLF
jgi:hypothetical protein